MRPLRLHCVVALHGKVLCSCAAGHVRVVGSPFARSDAQRRQAGICASMPCCCDSPSMSNRFGAFNTVDVSALRLHGVDPRGLLRRSWSGLQSVQWKTSPRNGCRRVSCAAQSAVSRWRAAICMHACVVKGKGGCVRDEENARDVLARRDREGLWRRIRMKTLNS